jgi:hypothetical protein
LKAANERLKDFLDGINNYLSCKNLLPTAFHPEFAIAETLSLEQLDKLTQSECFSYAYMLYQYADHVSSERAKQDTVVRWCEDNLNKVIAGEMEDMSHVIAKHEMKVANILRTNDLANNINNWKTVAESRLASLSSREYSVRRKADCLMEKGKRK